MNEAAFWRKQQAEFNQYTTEHVDIAAHWNASFAVWFLWPEDSPKGYSHRVFKALAASAAAHLPSTSNTGGAEMWQTWLSFMREENWGYKVTGAPIAVSKSEWDRMHDAKLTLSEVRAEFSQRE